MTGGEGSCTRGSRCLRSTRSESTSTRPSTLFRGEVLPQLREQDGYEGILVLATPDGRGLLLTLWETEEAADAQAATGFYAEQLERYVTLFRSPPGRERYEVAFADAPALAIG